MRKLLIVFFLLLASALCARAQAGGEWQRQLTAGSGITISGNTISASGGGGGSVNFYSVTDTITASQFTALSTTPDTLIAAQGSGTIIAPLNVVAIVLASGHTPFANGSNVLIGENLTDDIVGDPASAFYDTTDGIVFMGTSAGIGTGNGNTPLAAYDNQALLLGVSGADFTGGTGTRVVFTITYYLAHP